MFEFSLFYLEFDTIIGPRIEKSKTSNWQANNSNQKDNIADFDNPCSILQEDSQKNKNNNTYTRKQAQFLSINDKFGIETDPKLKNTIINNAFPESIKKLNYSQPYFFTFVYNPDHSADNLYDKYYCYSIYMSIPDKSMKRNFHQFSYVVVSKINNISIFKQFLISAFNSFQYLSSKKDNQISSYTNEIFDVLYSFLNQWNQIITNSIKTNHLENIDLPLIDGSINAKVTKSNSNQLEISENQQTNSISFFEALNLDKIKILDQNNKKYNSDSLYNQTLRLLWECLIFNKNILVLGNTPSEASEAVFAITSLIKQIKSFIIPYISVTDNFFIQLIKKTNNKFSFPTIVGVSNPISEFLIENDKKNNNSFFDFIYYVGFNDKVGFKELFNFSKSLTSFNNNTKSIQFNDNSKVLSKIESFGFDYQSAIDQFFIEIAQKDFSSLFKGKINVALLSKKLKENKIQISNYMKKKIMEKIDNKNIYELVAEKLVNTQFFINERKNFVYLSEFSQINLIEKNFVDNLIKDIKYDTDKIIDNYSGNGSQMKETEKIENKLMKTALKIYLHAIQTPINDDFKYKLKKVLKEIIAVE